MKIVRSRSTSKKMIACFFGLTGHIATIPLENRNTVNAKWHIEICLSKVINEIRKNKNRRIILHYDKASSHTSHETIDYLKDKNIELMSHCLYSPDLSPNDFSCSPTSNKCAGNYFHRLKRLLIHLKTMFLGYQLQNGEICFKNRLKQMEKYLNFKGR